MILWDRFLIYPCSVNIGLSVCVIPVSYTHLDVYKRQYSNRSGAVWFPPLREGLYQLKEAKPPKQYVPEKEAFQMYVDYNGNICIEGIPAARFQVFHKRSSEQKASFSVIKYDIRTGKRLEGAVFQLCQNHVPVATSTSDAEMCIRDRFVSAPINHFRSCQFKLP